MTFRLYCADNDSSEIRLCMNRILTLNITLREIKTSR